MKIVFALLTLVLCTRVFCEILNDIPSYIFEYAPLVYLYSEERYNPTDIKEYVQKFKMTTHYEYAQDKTKKFILKFNDDMEDFLTINMTNLRKNYTVLRPDDFTKTDILQVVDTKSGEMNNTIVISSRSCVLEMDNFDYTYPSILLGEKPNSFGYVKDAPSVLLVRDHGPESPFVDAYWFYFYGFNLGAFVCGTGPWGNHLGDWEHSIMRFRKKNNKDPFQNSIPESVWLSAHGGGFAYRYEALEKYNSNMGGKRPIIFSGKGTHANYASVGQHAHDVPFFFSALSDFTDRGIIWDPSKKTYAYSFQDDPKEKPNNAENIIFKPYRQWEIDTLGSPNWLLYHGRWGNLQLPLSDKRQHVMPFQKTFIDGPQGPIGKNLQREQICQNMYHNNNNIYWNLLKIGPGCQIRRTIKRGQGLDAESNDIVGDNCGIMLYKIKPRWLRHLVEYITWRGMFCYFMEYFTG